MVTPFNKGEMSALFYFSQHGAADKEVVNSPPNISFSAMISVGPPSVVVGFSRVQVAKGIYKRLCFQLIEKAPFFREKPCGVLILFGIGEVNGVVGGIKIPT